MRIAYEYRFHQLNVHGGDVAPDATLDLLGSQGWQMVGVTTVADGLVCALQRALEDNQALPDSGTLAAALVEPLAVPNDLEEPSRTMTPSEG